MSARDLPHPAAGFCHLCAWGPQLLFLCTFFQASGETIAHKNSLLAMKLATAAIDTDSSLGHDL